MNLKNFGNMTNLAHKLQFSQERLKQVQKFIVSNVKCQRHHHTKIIIIIDDHQSTLKWKSMLFACVQCKKVQNDFHYYKFQDLQQIMILSKQIQFFFQQQKQKIRLLKTAIKNHLILKKIRKTQWFSYFQCLNQFTKSFFDEKQSIQSEQAQKYTFQSIHQDYMDQLKFWMKNPDVFKETFLLQCSKTIIEKILWLKYNLSFFSLEIKNLLVKSHIANEQITQNHILCLFSKNKKKYIIENIEKVLIHNKKKLLNERINTLQKAYASLKMQNNLDVMSKELTKFIRLYNNIQQDLKKYLKFNMLKSNKYFSSNIIENIVSLKQPHNVKCLDIKYQQDKYQSEFLNLNRGDYVFNNEFRNDIFYDRQMEIQRDINTIIGQQYLYHKNGKIIRSSFNRMDQQFKSPQRAIQLSQPMKNNQKVVLKLRLNFQVQGKLKIGVRWSSNLQKFLSNVHDKCDFIKIKIIPDLSNQKKDQIKQNKIVNQIYETKDQNFKEQILIKFQVQSQNFEQSGQTFAQSQESQQNSSSYDQQQSNCKSLVYKVTEDDEISLSLNKKTRQLIFFNQTKQNVMCFKNLNVKDWFQLQSSENSQTIVKTIFPVYVFLLLSTSIPQIQILEK